MLKNNQTRYGWIAIALHWISAVGVCWMYYLGENIEHAKADGAAREVVINAIQFHTSIGVLFFAFLLARLISSLTQQRPKPFPQGKYLDLLAKWVTRLWLLLIAIQIFSAPLMIQSGGYAIKVFGTTIIPNFTGRVEWLHEGLEYVHSHAPNLFWPLLVLHVGGALKHFFVDKDKTLQRMMTVQK